MYFNGYQPMPAAPRPPMGPSAAPRGFDLSGMRMPTGTTPQYGASAPQFSPYSPQQSPSSIFGNIYPPWLNRGLPKPGAAPGSGAPGSLPGGGALGGGGTPGTEYGEELGRDFWNINPVVNNRWDDTETVRNLIRRMMSGGFFNPFGTPGYAQMYEGAAQQGRQDAIGRATTAADIRGLTPEQAQFARTMAGVNAESGAARGYADFRMQDALSNRDFIRQLMGQHYGFNYTPQQQP